MKKSRETSQFSRRTMNPSENPELQVNLGSPNNKKIHVILSGWAYEDLVPEVVKTEMFRVLGEKKVDILFFLVGVNTFRGDLTKVIRPERVRAGFRNLALLNFELMVQLLIR